MPFTSPCPCPRASPRIFLGWKNRAQISRKLNRRQYSPRPLSRHRAGALKRQGAGAVRYPGVRAAFARMCFGTLARNSIGWALERMAGVTTAACAAKAELWLDPFRGLHSKKLTGQREKTRAGATRIIPTQRVAKLRALAAVKWRRHGGAKNTLWRAQFLS